jgi:hypothetical protein
MGRGTAVFAVLFVLLPALLFAGALALPSMAVALALLGLLMLITGFTMGLAFVEP